jgi:hypothetical protein
MDKLLKFLWILQEKENSDGSEKLFRLNPYNPLSYIMIIIIGIAVILFSLIMIIFSDGISSVTSLFKWN